MGFRCSATHEPTARPGGHCSTLAGMTRVDRTGFRRLAEHGNVIALSRQLMSDQITPVLAYRRLVAPDERTAPSFLFESVEGGAAVGRYSFLGAQPSTEVITRGHEVTVTDHRRGQSQTTHEDDPLDVPRRLIADRRLVRASHGADPIVERGCGGWVGYAGYDTVRYLEAQSIPFATAPPDDRGLADMHLGLYRQVAVFDHVSKLLHAVVYVYVDEHDSPDDAWRAGMDELDAYVERLERPGAQLAAGAVELDVSASPPDTMDANVSREQFEDAVRRCREYIAAGDIFQVVISQRFRRFTSTDPFDVYRALRIVNPSPYMIYLQAADCMLVASSPEILCRLDGRTAVTRPLAGTRRRGRTPDEDAALEADLRASAKEQAEHVMLVDLGRNDLGRVCELGSIELPAVMDVERYSHVMHLSSTVTGRLREELDAWDLLRSTLPVGTVSGAPKVRAMQIIDELETTRRGPYAGGIGMVGFNGDADIALALRTMVVPTAARADDQWAIDLQAGAGIVADSDPAAEYEETINKAAGLGRAIDLAEQAFVDARDAVDASSAT